MYVTILTVAALFGLSISAGAQDFMPPRSGPRDLVVISDLHLGPGCPKGICDVREDFRWPKALAGLLTRINVELSNPIDLVIAGDMLELWQPPSDINCAPDDAELGCTAEEMRQIAEAVVRGHTGDGNAITALAEFSKRGENRLWIVPGNHDAALLLDSVWEVLATALDAQSGRVARVSSGIWTSPDGRLMVEHGHQIGSDANRYRDWPIITGTDPQGGQVRLIRPWGERFVQRLFNEVEVEYPIIDNLSPETAGARYRVAAEGKWSSAADAARFIAFNLFETSLQQKLQILGRQPDGTTQEWDLASARGLREQLFLLALPENDPLRISAERSNSPETTALRAELARLATDHEALSDADVLALCDQIAVRTKRPACAQLDLNSTVEKLFVSRDRILRTHLADRRRELPRLQTLIYGHTHELEPAHCVEVDGLTRVDVLNTGAFQRVMDERDYQARLSQRPDITSAASGDARGGEGLSRLTLEVDFKACYTVVLAPNVEGRYRARTWRWVMDESDAAGRLVLPGDQACHWGDPPEDQSENRCPR
jgi:predicted phosphodiesterase